MYLRHGGYWALKENEPGTHHLILLPGFSLCLLRNGALFQRSYCGLLYSKGFRGECGVGRHGSWETVGAGGRAWNFACPKSNGTAGCMRGQLWGSCQRPIAPHTAAGSWQGDRNRWLQSLGMQAKGEMTPRQQQGLAAAGSTHTEAGQYQDCWSPLNHHSMMLFSPYVRKESAQLMILSIMPLIKEQ